MAELEVERSSPAGPTRRSQSAGSPGVGSIERQGERRSSLREPGDTSGRHRDWSVLCEVLRCRLLVLSMLATGTSGLFVTRFGLGWDAVVYVPLLGLLGPVLAVLDVELMRLPNRLVLPAIPLQFGALVMVSLARAQTGPLARAASAAALTGLFLGVLALGSDGHFGWGDVKVGSGLLAPALAWSSWSALITAGWVAFASAAGFGIVLRHAGGRRAFAFGPFLFLAAATVTLWRGPHA